MLSSIPESRDLEDSPELLAPLVLLTDFLCEGVEWVEWWLWLWESGLRQTNSQSGYILPARLIFKLLEAKTVLSSHL